MAEQTTEKKARLSCTLLKNDLEMLSKNVHKNIKLLNDYDNEIMSNLSQALGHFKTLKDRVENEIDPKLNGLTSRFESLNHKHSQLAADVHVDYAKKLELLKTEIQGLKDVLKIVFDRLEKRKISSEPVKTTQKIDYEDIQSYYPRRP